MTVILMTASARIALAISTGAPEGSSGAPKEVSCVVCHGGSANTGRGAVRIEFSGAGVYSPGEKVRMRVVIEDPAARRWGFQLSARPQRNTDSGAGKFETAGGEMQVLSAGALEWITHTAAGTKFGAAGSVTYEFDWTAPAGDTGPVVFYAAANAANGNGSTSGDSIYTSSLVVDAAAVQRPNFTSSSVTEMATGQPGVAPGAWISITGTDLAAQVAHWSPVQGKPFDTTLGKVTVKVNGTAAPLSFVSPTRLTFLVPAATPEGDVSILVENDGRVGDTVTVRSARALPAPLTTQQPDSDPQRFFATATTAGAGTALSLVSHKGLYLGKPEVDGRAVRGAFPGEEIDIYAIGLGRTDPEFPVDTLFSGNPAVAEPPVVQIGEVVVMPSLTAMVAPGIYVVRVKVPEAQEPGDVPVFLEVNSVRSRENVFLFVQKQP